MITVDPTGGFNVPSLSTPGKIYNVFFDDHKQQFRCECQYFALFPFNTDKICNHIRRVKGGIEKREIVICPKCHHTRGKHAVDFGDNVEWCVIPNCKCGGPLLVWKSYANEVSVI